MSFVHHAVLLTLSRQINSVSISSSTHEPKQQKQFDFSKVHTRRIAIRFAYLGWNYNGLAVQVNDVVPTVEGAILSAMQRTRLIPSVDPNCCDLSRCGRTDKGVSALRQVIALTVRSALTPEEQQDPANDEKEIDYLHTLNQVLPDDIRLYEVALRPPEGFDARFSCTHRHYKYFFHGEGLDLEKMGLAASYFLGEHDFRNFCKIDGSKQITNFKRAVISSSIMRVDTGENSDLYCFDLQGTAFLWHQVRSMIAILFLVGQNLESPSVIQTLLDVEKTPCRPVYEMASDIPLVLYDCGFPPMEWKSFKTQDSLKRLEDRLFNLWHDHWMKYTMVSTMSAMVGSSVHPPYVDYRPVNGRQSERVTIKIGDGVGRNMVKYIPLSERKVLDPPEVTNERWRQRKSKSNLSKTSE